MLKSKYFLWFAGILLLLGLAGCKKNLFRDRSEDYVNARTYPPLKVPANLKPEAFNQEYEFPSN